MRKNERFAGKRIDGDAVGLIGAIRALSSVIGLAGKPLPSLAAIGAAPAVLDIEIIPSITCGINNGRLDRVNCYAADMMISVQNLRNLRFGSRRIDHK